jgi:Carboxypeptidase regulatory-like domain
LKWKAAKFVFAARVLLLVFLLTSLLYAQATASISGVITDSSGKPVANATVSAKSSATGQSAEVKTDSAGKFSLLNLSPGTYTVSVSAEGFAAKLATVTLAAASEQALSLVLSAELPNAPSAAPSLSDLGFTPQQTQANAQLQALLDRRTHMLKIHQRLGLITAIPMAAALITGPMAKAKGRNGQTITEPSNANLDFHAALGGATTALYFATAYYAIRAPRVPGTHKHGAIRVHEALAFIHGPGMILTPILGAMAFKQEQDGEKVHGIASAHGAVAYITAASYGAAIVAVSWPIHLKFWEK